MTARFLDHQVLCYASKKFPGVSKHVMKLLSMDLQDSLQPAIRIKGADYNGSDLILSANLTEDRMALMATTPLERTPLAMGDHPVHVSLNGQQFADLPSLDPTVSELTHSNLSMLAWPLLVT